MNDQNLTPFTSENAAKAAAKSHEARRRNKSLRELTFSYLSRTPEGSDLTNEEIIVQKTVELAKKGNPSARKWVDNITKDRNKQPDQDNQFLKTCLLYAGVPQKYWPGGMPPSDNGNPEQSNLHSSQIIALQSAESVPSHSEEPLAAPQCRFDDYTCTPTLDHFKPQGILPYKMDGDLPVKLSKPIKIIPAKSYFKEETLSFSPTHADGNSNGGFSEKATENTTVAISSERSLNKISFTHTGSESNSTNYHCPDSYPAYYELTDQSIDRYFSADYIAPASEEKSKKLQWKNSTPKIQPRIQSTSRPKQNEPELIGGVGYIRWASPYSAPLGDDWRLKIKERSSCYDNASQNSAIIDTPPENCSESRILLPDQTVSESELNNSSRYSHAKRENIRLFLTLSAEIPLHAVPTSFIVGSPEYIEYLEKRKNERKHAKNNVTDTLFETLHTTVFPNCNLTIKDLMCRKFVIDVLTGTPKNFERSFKLLNEVENLYEKRHPEKEEYIFYARDYNGVRCTWDELLGRKKKADKTGTIQPLLPSTDFEDEYYV